MATLERLKRNREIKANFLVLKEVPKEYRLRDPKEHVGFIYCIENQTNGFKYIGSTISNWKDVRNPSYFGPIKKRSSGYIYEYNSAMKESPSIRKTRRHIIQAMCEEGIENFIMYPIAETNENNYHELENFFIEKFNTIERGYNGCSAMDNAKVRFSDVRRMYTRAQRVGISESIIAVNMNQKEMVFADSMKLFGDFLGTTKDQIKNNARGARSCKGWFIFYLNPTNRRDIVERVVIPDNFGTQKNGKTRNHSAKYKKFYLELFDAIEKYLENPKLSGLFEDFKLLPPIVYK